MTLTQWFIFFLIVQVIHFASTWKMYKAAGRQPWEAIVPVYNAIVLMKIINRPTWWVILLFIPIVNLIMFPVIWVETLRSFGKNTTTDTLLGLFTFGLYIAYVNYTQPLNYIPERSLKPKSKSGDTVSSLLFAVVVATIVHTYILQPFTIPSSSLEKTLLVGDFLFVSKLNYGARTPMTTVALPMVHDTIPVIKTKSYSNWPQLPKFRLPGFQKVERNDIVVFNWPVDTVRQFFVAEDGVKKPIDKKSNYVKRCVGLPGDNLSIVDGVIQINGKILVLPERARPEYSYKIATDGKTPIDFGYIFREYDITDGGGFMSQAQDTIFIKAMPMDTAEKIKNIPGITLVERFIFPKEIPSAIFPKGYTNWSVDNIGPLYIPEAGKKVELNAKTLPFYKKIITDYEGHELATAGGQILIDGKAATSYTFGQNYYYMMGDNRHNSEDSRFWGFVPEDHIVGKPVFIWMSWDGNKPGLNKIRWERLFTTVGGDGQPVSYFKIFLILMAIYAVANHFYKKRQANKTA